MLFGHRLFVCFQKAFGVCFFLFYSIGVYSFHQNDSINTIKSKFFIAEGTVVFGIEKEQIVVVKRENRKSKNVTIFISPGTVFVGFENLSTSTFIDYTNRNSNQGKVKIVQNGQNKIKKVAKLKTLTEVRLVNAPFNTPFSFGKFSYLYLSIPSSNSNFFFLNACLNGEIVSCINLVSYTNYISKIQNKDFLNSYLLDTKFTTRPPPFLSKLS